jgi:hypothetical protein
MDGGGTVNVNFKFDSGRTPISMSLSHYPGSTVMLDPESFKAAYTVDLMAHNVMSFTVMRSEEVYDDSVAREEWENMVRRSMQGEIKLYNDNKDSAAVSLAYQEELNLHRVRNAGIDWKERYGESEASYALFKAKVAAGELG